MSAITRFFLDNPRARGLPRKFKIALSTSHADRAFAAIHDVGLIAVVGPDGGPAFRVLAAGGLASQPMSGVELHQAWPAAEILTPLLAAVDLFQDHGNRKVRSQARIKHVLRKLKAEAFTALYREYLARVEREPPPRVEAAVTLRTPAPWSLAVPDDAVARRSGYYDWFRSSVERTWKPGRVFVTVRFDHGGKVRGSDLRQLGDLCERYGEPVLHLTQQQNALLRDVAVEALPELWHALQQAGLARPGALWTGNVTSCPGTTTCNLGITQSRNLADAVMARMASREDTDLTVKFSGCHNACGQHHIGTIGGYGAVRRANGTVAPHYRLMVGGGVDAAGAHFGHNLGLVPARRMPEAVDRLVAWADGQRQPGQTTADVLRAADATTLAAVVGDLADVEALDALDFVDVGMDAPFDVIQREGECAA